MASLARPDEAPSSRKRIKLEEDAVDQPTAKVEAVQSTTNTTTKNEDTHQRQNDPEPCVPRQVNEQGDVYYELSEKKRVVIREYKGNLLVDIREVGG